ncbi:hypothetical protein EJ05DRAFT_476770 [Pseudovirgaria hyperparasitica]|uniref:Uncharacterized protein n=1 Tax=Pseudovirgaria hyperparasitica TaxID=470096 RepID=A0A6A6W6D1_9PEZI|nr:uncharacterized protein EJ05DRAFT_476770 [Pseudovirgaria hyperparasitica]KAF2757520.1 hypothetical protein EJ05DRAFT_476770 [Pseudovirgaria hyperparasitica]
MIGWVALVLSLQGYLAEASGSGSSGSSATSGIFGVGMSVMALGVCYMQLFMPQPAGFGQQGTGTGAPGAVPA